MNKMLCALFISVLSVSSVHAYPFQRYVQDASERYGVEEALIRAIIKAESNYRQYAVSHKNARGLMQLMITTAREYEPWVSRFQLLEEADVNIDIGTRHLKDLDRQVRRRYPGVKGLDRITLIAAAYNAGWGRVVRSGGRVPRILETKTYVKRVTRYYQSYGGKLKPVVAAKSASKPEKAAPPPLSGDGIPGKASQKQQASEKQQPVSKPEITEGASFSFTGETIRLMAVFLMLFAGYVLMGWSHLTWIASKDEGGRMKVEGKDDSSSLIPHPSSS